MQQKIEACGVPYDFFSSFIDNLEDEILILDAEGVVLGINTRLLELWGGTRAGYLGENRASLARKSPGYAGALSFFDLVMQKGERLTETYSSVDADGRMNYYHVNAFPLRDKEGRICRVMLTRRNTTAEVHIEQRLYQSQKMAAIGELSTYIAHEIRNPLFTIGGFANALLRAANLDESAREKARIIVEESQRLDDILKNIINFARPTEQTLGDVDLNALVAQTVEVMSFGAEKQIPIVLDLAGGIPKIHGNAEMLKQCLINLIKNAREAMANGTIHVRTHCSGDSVFLEVADDGPGIAPELQEKIFSPFYSTKDKGAGLGLAMTRKIINEIGGKLLLHSKVGHGTVVSMALNPALAAASGPDGIAAGGEGQ